MLVFAVVAVFSAVVLAVVLAVVVAVVAAAVPALMPVAVIVVRNGPVRRAHVYTAYGRRVSKNCVAVVIKPSMF